ncbi:MAG TPA: condensation domain-containing protein, partial [Candidatus Dormibacteraeota bacterium]|nr:condensation domain-containing protein [Candidatus Dormibacteraeota bacterium]
MARGPLVRVVLLRLSDEDHVIVLVMHHIVGDGWSIGLFDRELALLYGAFSCGRPSPLPDLTLQYADFAHWQRLWLQGREPQRLLELGRRQLLGARFVLGLPLDRPRPAAPTYGGARLEFVVPADRTRRLEELARREGATPFMVLLATFQALLGRLTGQDDLCVGTPVAGRTRLETEPLIGVFVNSLVLRADLSSDPTFVELLGRVRSTALDALARQDLPFEKFVEVLRPDRHPSVHPLFQAMFVLQDGVQDAPGLPGLQAESVDFEMGSTPFDLTLIVSKRDGALEAVMEYSTDLFDRPSIERMAGHFETLLEVFLADPSRRPSEIPLVGLTETLREAQDARRDTVAVAGPAPHAPPRGSTERALARIWADLLGRERVGIHDNFFEAGGHSLIALQLVSRVREILHVEIPVRRVFERPTIAGLAADIDGPVAARSREDGIERVLGRAPSALSSAQRRLWFIDQMQPGTPAYNIPLALRLRGRLDEDALERSLATIIGRHEALRTVFPVVDGEPLQCVLPPRPPGTRPLDLAGLPPGAR